MFYLGFNKVVPVFVYALIEVVIAFLVVKLFSLFVITFLGGGVTTWKLTEVFF